jgi:hypothetical protein
MQWFMPVIPDTGEVEIKRRAVETSLDRKLVRK